MKRLMICCLVLAPIMACQPKTTQDPTSNDTDSAAVPANGNGTDSETSSQPEAAPQVTVRVASWEEIEKFLQSHRNKIVVADIWSTSCIPCMRELPHLFELQRLHPENLVAVTINIDYAGLPDEPVEQAQAKALEFLKKQPNPLATHFVSSTPDEDVLKALDIPSVPAVLVFDRTGKRVRTFGLDGEEFSYEKSITPFVKVLVEGNPTAGGAP